jgi:uncharacterized membrane protein YbaN (DUF454 family)
MKQEKEISSLARLIYLMFGGIFLIIGLIGILIPVIPGFIFLVPAFYCFAKVSPKLKKFAKFGKRNG